MVTHLEPDILEIEVKWALESINMNFPGFPGGPVVKNPLASAGDARDVHSIPGSGRSPGAVAQSLSLVWPFATPWTVCSMPGFPVLHYLLEFAQTHVH